MRYQHLLLPALATIVVAKDPLSPEDWTQKVPDALPVEELRNIPVPTYSMATEATHQDIPYTHTSAVASMISHMAVSPLSVFPAATHIPLNAAGTSYTDTDKDVNPNNKLKRTPSGFERHLRKRAACDPQPTLANRYNVNLANASTFRNDPNIASVANNANPAPTGYYQTFKDLQGASSTMNYLGFVVVNTTKGYDVDFCAAKCNAKAGCLAFNIYFVRSPTQTPGTNCPNPPAFANIKCSLWGTALDAKTATNKGGGNFKFVSAVAGSNAYNSYKLGAPLAGYNMLSLSNSVMNAPLYDCTHTWTYLGYQLLQAGSVDPRLCAAACDAQTAYNKAHPAHGPGNATVAPVACNAFGSYILTKTNTTKVGKTTKTASFQLGQVCTFYTYSWDKKYAVNQAAFDDKIKAKYTYSFSTFYGKIGAGLNCTGTHA
jgi:hypothetical protein